MRNIATVDIGGTNARVLILDENKKELDRLKISTNPDDPLDTLKQLCDFIKKYSPVAIGVSAPGPADYKNGILKDLPNLPGWRFFNLKQAFTDLTGVDKIRFANDAKLMALAHHNYFNGTADDVTQFFTVSTGLGAGLIIDNKIYDGAFGRSQEVAFLPSAWVKESGKGLGEGAVELFASGSGIASRGKTLFHKEISTKEVFSLADSGNHTAIQILDDGAEALANLIASAAALINPSMMVFDGSITRHDKEFVDKAIELSKSRMYPAQFADIKFLFGELGDDAALFGAFELVKEMI